jgi:glutamate racemase
LPCVSTFNFNRILTYLDIIYKNNTRLQLKVGVFDSGLGGLTVVSAITDIFNGADIIYIADTAYAPYGEKSPEQILNRCVKVTQFLIIEHNIDALIVACNTATSAAIKTLREMFKKLIIIGAEPGIKPAIESTKSNSIGVLATPATLQGDKYQLLVNDLSSIKEVKLFEQACPGLVAQIEKGEISDIKTTDMLSTWLKPMRENGVDTIVLGCTHYPLVSHVIQDIMNRDINLIHTGPAIANRLKDLSIKQGHINKGKLNISIFFTGEINMKMIDSIFEDYTKENKITIRKQII